MPDKNCFVLMPFADKYLEVYEQVYRPVSETHGLRCWRVDEIARPGSITRDIVEGILDADLIIADLTGRNPNVFYELGIAHAVGNKTIMTAQSHEDVPFDIGSYRVIFYEQSIAGSKKLEEKLGSAVKELLQALDRTNNPFQEVAASKVQFKRRNKAPLIKYIDLASMPWRGRQYLTEKGINTVADLERLDLEDMAATDGVGRSALQVLVSGLLEHDLYEDGEKLQQFALRHRLLIRTLNGSTGYRTW